MAVRPKIIILPPHDDGTRFQWFAHDERLRRGILVNTPMEYSKVFSSQRVPKVNFERALTALKEIPDNGNQ